MRVCDVRRWRMMYCKCMQTVLLLVIPVEMSLCGNVLMNKKLQAHVTCSSSVVEKLPLRMKLFFAFAVADQLK